MTLRLSEILERDALHLMYHLTKAPECVLRRDGRGPEAGELMPEGGALPITLNAALALLPNEHPPLKRDKEMTDWSVENDAKYATFLNQWRLQIDASPKQGRKVRAIAEPLHQTITSF